MQFKNNNLLILVIISYNVQKKTGEIIYGSVVILQNPFYEDTTHKKKKIPKLSRVLHMYIQFT